MRLKNWNNQIWKRTIPDFYYNEEKILATTLQWIKTAWLSVVLVGSIFNLIKIRRLTKYLFTEPGKSLLKIIVIPDKRNKVESDQPAYRSRQGISSIVLISKHKFWNQQFFNEIPSLPSRTNHHCEGMTASLKLKEISLITVQAI